MFNQCNANRSVFGFEKTRQRSSELGVCAMPPVSNIILLWFKTWQWCLRIRSKSINSTSEHTFDTGNGFSDMEFLHDVKVLAVRRRFGLFWQFFTAHTNFRPYYYFRFKIWRHIWIQSIRFPIKTRSVLARDTIFGEFCDDKVGRTGGLRAILVR